MLAAVAVVAIVQQAPALTPRLRFEYERRFASCELRRGAERAANAAVALIVMSKPTYERVERETGVPWYVVGLLHVLESDGRFDRRLSDGRRQSARESWEQSAINALNKERTSGAWRDITVDEWRRWTVADVLFRAELFNGSGYIARGVPSPYIFGQSNEYRRGKFTRDGHYNARYVSRQVGAAPLLRLLIARGVVMKPEPWLTNCEEN